MPPSPFRRELAATLSLGLPLALSQIAQIALETVDVMMMGRLSAEALAAGSLGLNLYFAVLLFGIGTTTAAAPLIAQALGAGRARQARRAYRQGLWVAVALGVPGVAVLWSAEPILLALGQPAPAAAEAAVYLRWMSGALIPALWFQVSRSLLAAFGQTRVVMIVSLVAVPLNALLDWLFMFGPFGLPRLGLAGAGLATTLVQIGMAAVLFHTVTRAPRVRRLGVLARLWRPDWRTFGDILVIGTPIGLTMVLEMGMFLTAVLMIGLISVEALAANQIAVQLVSISFMVPLGLSQAATVRVGLAVGRGLPPADARRAWAAALLGGLVFMTGTALLFWLAPTPLAGLFLTTEAAAGPVAALAASFLAVAAAFQLADATQVITAGALRGLKDTRMPLLIAAVGFWAVGVPLGAALAFPAGLGGVGVWWGLLAGLSAVAVLLTLRFLSLTRHLSIVSSG